jgi:hypothetical protein
VGLKADVAQLVEHLFCKQVVGGSSPLVGFKPLLIGSVAKSPGRCEMLILDEDPDYSRIYSIGIYVYVDPSTDRVVGKFFAESESANVYVKGYEDCSPWKTFTTVELSNPEISAPRK